MSGSASLTDIVEELAKILHETGRRAVEARKIYRSDLPVKPFAEWADLDEATKEGRRMMAQDLIDFLPGVDELVDELIETKAEARAQNPD